jgi:hypothetical protein
MYMLKAKMLESFAFSKKGSIYLTVSFLLFPIDLPM